MANSLGINLERGDEVILSAEHYRGNDEDRVFICEGGFGMHHFTSGAAIFGRFKKDGEKARISGYAIEKKL